MSPRVAELGEAVGEHDRRPGARLVDREPDAGFGVAVGQAQRRELEASCSGEAHAGDLLDGAAEYTKAGRGCSIFANAIAATCTSRPRGAAAPARLP